MLIVNNDKCIGCGQCIEDCFPKDILLLEGKAVIENIKCMKCGHCIAVCPKAAISSDEYKMEEVKEYNKETFHIDSDNLMNFIKFRRSIRHFKDKAVEANKILKIIEAGRYTQTGSNAQDVSYVVVQEELPWLKELTYETLKGIGEEMIASADENAPIRYANMWINMYQNYKENPKNDRIFFNAPVLIMVLAKSQISGGLASSNMELITNTLELGTFFSGFFLRAAYGNEKIRERLGIKDGKELISCMVIGYPDIQYARTVPRKEAEISWI